MSKRRLKIYSTIVLVNIVIYGYFITFVKPHLFKGDKNVRNYIPVYLSDSLNVRVKSSYLARASFYISTMNEDSIRVDAYDFLDYRNKDYSNLIQSTFKLIKTRDSDTLWISNEQTASLKYLILDNVR